MERERERERENIFKPTVRNEGLHQESNDNGVTIVHFAISKNSIFYKNNVPTPKLS